MHYKEGEGVSVLMRELAYHIVDVIQTVLLCGQEGCKC